MNLKKTFVILVLISILFIVYSFSLRERDEVTISEIQIPLSFEEISLEYILQCHECATKTMNLSNFPIKNFFRDVWVLADDSLLVSETPIDFKQNVLVQTKINGETLNFLLDSRIKVYSNQGKYYKLSEPNYARLVDVASIF